MTSGNGSERLTVEDELDKRWPEVGATGRGHEREMAMPSMVLQALFTGRLRYNHAHHHSGLGLHTPSDVHHGLAEAKREQRAVTLTAAHRAHPERFVRGRPRPPRLPQAVWINRPKTTSEAALAPSAGADAEARGHGGGAPSVGSEARP